jgi:hypothetical protein
MIEKLQEAPRGGKGWQMIFLKVSGIDMIMRPDKKKSYCEEREWK